MAGPEYAQVGKILSYVESPHCDVQGRSRRFRATRYFFSQLFFNGERRGLASQLQLSGAIAREVSAPERHDRALAAVVELTAGNGNDVHKRSRTFAVITAAFSEGLRGSPTATRRELCILVSLARGEALRRLEMVMVGGRGSRSRFVHYTTDLSIWSFPLVERTNHSGPHSASRAGETWSYGQREVQSHSTVVTMQPVQPIPTKGPKFLFKRTLDKANLVLVRQSSLPNVADAYGQERVSGYIITSTHGKGGWEVSKDRDLLLPPVQQPGAMFTVWGG
ncbi:hypothetical protein EXIGLDRAFT_704382 [Exidia glandulosa HHB12029]|uniref:Uncharacterized protein n=1 Tax=Exidia glandulosa HHB12029 TaxID=1314781 RepID=A0A165BQA4_EXIGL|nr:hypothetical protein EXIGLDRAFT_704382 [Exidia glandulosa HHB12029]